MIPYVPPVQDMHFLLTQVLGFSHPDLDADTVEAVLGEAAKLATDVLAPLNQIGDRNEAKLEGDKVTTAPGFKEAYKQYCEGGWNAVPFDPAYGGQGLPWALAFPIQEMWQAANMSFGLCPLLNQGAIKAISFHGSQEQKDFYLPKLISGEWTGTMNITESQAGSDLGLLRAKAERQKDGSYKISGQKIFITYGEHDFTGNIIHLVLARIPDAPADVKGLSLFIVPKILEGGSRNKVKCIGLEHKLGIHASPTCTMEFDGATGYLIGGENEGLKCMFTMMNNARLSVGLQGVAIGARAYQTARDFAAARVQGKSFVSGDRVAIAAHADVRRMLLTMRSLTQAGRALTYEAAIALDKAGAGDKKAQERVGLLTPVVKAWCTDNAVEVASICVQVYGGMGFIEETGVAQYMRDSRILPIYEGTNGIQALDLVFRKVADDGGKAAHEYFDALEARLLPDDKKIYAPALADLRAATKAILDRVKAKDMDGVAGIATAYLGGFGVVAGGVLLAHHAAVAKEKADAAYAERKSETAKFYTENILPRATGALAIASRA